jgi:hypothetical protein
MCTVGRGADRLASEWRVLQGYVIANLQSAMEYRASFISQVVFMFLNDVLLLFFWWVLFSRLPSLNSWQMRDVVILYGVGASTFAFQAILFGHSFALARTIAEGGLDYYLVLPRRPLWHVLISRSSASAWGDLLFGLVAYAWAVGGEARKLLLFPFFLVCGGLVSTAYGVLAGSLASFWGNSESFSHQLYGAQHNFHGPNTDGCHLSSCRFVRVSDCHFHTGDDCIAIDGGGTKPAEHIVINNCTFRTLTNMCRIYTNIDPWHLQEDAVVSGEEVVRHIAISNCTVADASSALNIVARKGTIEHIVVSNLTLHMELPGTPIFIMTDEGTIRHVSFEHITATANGVCTVSAKSGDVIDGIRMSNCHFGIQPLHKIYGLGFPDPIPKYWDSHEAPHGIFLRHAKGVHLHNVSVQWLAELPGEQWSALWALDIARLNVTGFSALHVGKEPVIRLIGAPKATLHRLQALTASPVFLQVDKVTQEGLSLAPSDGLAMVTDEADTCAEESDAVFCYQVRR